MKDTRADDWGVLGTSTAVFSTLSGGTFINCGSAKPKCCIAPDNHVNSPTTTVNKGVSLENNPLLCMLELFLLMICVYGAAHCHRYQDRGLGSLP